MVQKDGGSLSSGSSARTDANEVFNIAVESDVLTLLKKIHRSSIDQDVKNDLRDKLFAHKKGEGSDMVAVFKDAGFSISFGSDVAETQPENQEKENDSVPFGHRRAVPSFGSYAPKKVTLKVASNVPPETQPEEEKEPEVSEVETKKQDKTKEIEVETQSEKVEVPEPAVKPAERIKEIKKAVNQLVGNPVSLVDANNEVGREYMNALLSAMKTVNGGSAEEVTKAMSRLEEVYTAVQKVVAGGERQAKNDAPVLEKKEEEIVEPVQTNASETKEADAVESAQVTTAKTEQKETDTIPVTAPNEPNATETTFTPDAVLEKKKEENQKTEVAESTTEATEEGASEGSGIMSVAKEKQLQKLMQKNRAKEVEDAKKKEEESRKTMDPLMTPEVGAGLDQLLSEWSLFKSSGFLGTGPAGVDHPLYKKIAHLTMAAVIAGRFEGATGQVKQSITDYMNGWRYEEGIVHEHSETFEHYLRRVIAHILSGTQKKKEVD